ncbi:MULTISPECIES: ferritin-like domain-containing protein [Dyella]|uniref:Ferritin-like domain-containing protein n=2 Tax=Dyella TaxID=231454 RepID=A0A4R0YIA7_9GAMM|nr:MULTISPECIES: ferritin-like domain-containing protein [Dyella]TBR36790.1 ferritin-like domain-containing protein [Dyella terrae]TCI08119.1 ferritin-like domain-containing protein [Dyella soli]
MSYNDSLPWTLESLDLEQIQLEQIRHNEELFFLLCSSSFVESGSDLYTHNLVEHFAGDQTLQTWLSQHWEHEELQHGRALAAYVKKVWPEFDWERGFKSFWDEYGAVCTSEQLEDSRGLELAARCVVETGTASLYRALNDITDEPVLKQLTSHIKSDEVRHYKHFYQAFRQYREREGLGRYRVFRAILKRVNEIRSEDSDIALRHVFNQCYPQHVGNDAEFKRVTGKAQALLRRNIPAEMTVKMLLKPLDLPAKLQDWLEKPLAKAAERLFLNA